MKNLYLLLIAIIFLGTSVNLTAQGVAINTDGSAADASSMLDITSITKGVLIPRMTAAQRGDILSPVVGLMVYQTDGTKGFYFYDGSSWAVVGSGAMGINDLSDGIATGGSVFLGSGAGTNDDGTNNYNVGEGANALTATTSGANNTSIGGFALETNVANSGSVAIGYGAMLYADDRSSGRYTYNTAVGYLALKGSGTASANTGQHNTAIGHEALEGNTSGYYNSAVGSAALQDNTTGGGNTAIGVSALYGNNTGIDNIAVGVSALAMNYSGLGNTAIGNMALFWNVVGDYNTAVGYISGPQIDPLSNTGAFGYQAIPTNSNTIHIGNTSITAIKGQVTWSTYSDERFKRNIQENVRGLDFIMKLRPVTYHWKIRELNDHLGTSKDAFSSETMQRAIDQQEAIVYTGFLAQEVEKAAKETSFDFSGVHAPDNDQAPYSISYAEFVVPLVKAVQEQQKLIEKLQKRIEELENN
ncbi:tail fiber domain-containing protein [Bacteroidota bacterium]